MPVLAGDRFQVGRLYAHCCEKFDSESQIRLDLRDAWDDTVGDFSKDAFGPEEHGDETHCVPSHVSGSASAMRPTHRVDRFWVE